MASIATPANDRASIEAFRRDVLEASLTRLVLVDFWATWCGPCKTLTPLLERVVASYGPRVSLVKVDVDKERLLAQQFRIQSVPTVYAFLGGQPVDAFAGALPERELRAFIDRLLSGAPAGQDGSDLAADIEAALAEGEALLREGAAAQAVELARAVSEAAPGRPDVTAFLARALLAAGDADAAEAALAALPAEAQRDAAVGQARAAIALAREAGPAGDLAQLRAAHAANPEDMETAFALAGAQIAAGDRDGAADTLLDMIRRDRGWKDGAARERLLKLFESVGLADPWTVAQRRRLSAILFA
ncbi:MAG: tetratricopeptide repeat protein [Sphingomonadaceae bacterium]